MSIWFVTPAWRRYSLSAVCFAQRKQVIAALAREGVEAHCVVIADDANLELARAAGFDTIEQNNNGLGRKFNDGMEYAAKQSAEWIVPIGSDSWVDPAYFLPLPDRNETRTSRIYCAVTKDRLAELSVSANNGAGPYMFHRSLLEGCGFRPAQDELMRSIDRSTLRGIGKPIPWAHQNLHPYQYVGFRGVPTITPYRVLVEKCGVAERTDPWDRLARHYPPELVAMARSAMEEE